MRSNQNSSYCAPKDNSMEANGILSSVNQSDNLQINHLSSLEMNTKTDAILNSTEESMIGPDKSLPTIENFDHSGGSSMSNAIQLESLSSSEGTLSMDPNHYYENLTQPSIMVYRYQIPTGNIVPFDTLVPVSMQSKVITKSEETVDLLQVQNSIGTGTDTFDHSHQSVTQPVYIMPESQNVFINNRNSFLPSETSDALQTDFHLATSNFEPNIVSSDQITQNQFNSLYNPSNNDTDSEVALTLASLGNLKSDNENLYHKPQKELFEPLLVEEPDVDNLIHNSTVSSNSTLENVQSEPTLILRSRKSKLDPNLHCQEVLKQKVKRRRKTKKTKETVTEASNLTENGSSIRENLLGELLKASKHCEPASLVPEGVMGDVIPAVGYRVMDMSNLSEMILMMHKCSNASSNGTIVTQEQVSLREGAVSQLSIICTGCQEGAMCATSNKSSSQSWDINARVERLSKEFNLEEKDVQRMLEILGIFYRPCPQPTIAQEIFVPTSERKRAPKKPTDGKKSFTCKVCSKTFLFVNHLKSHMNLHNNSLHTCPYCKAYFKKSYNLKQHVKKHNNEKYDCNFCNKVYSDRSTLLAHIKYFHQKTTPKHECNFCNKKFSLKTHFQEHLRIHTNEKPYECDTCHRRFNHQSSIRKHMVTHDTSSKYKCRLCGKWFRWLLGVRKHLTVQHQLKKSDLAAHVFTAVAEEVLPELIPLASGKKIITSASPSSSNSQPDNQPREKEFMNKALNSKSSQSLDKYEFITSEYSTND